MPAPNTSKGSTSVGKRRREGRKGLDTPLVAKLLERKLLHGVKQLKRTAKTAHAFETRRLIKSLKQLQETAASSEEVAQVESQLAILKGLDHDTLAISALRMKLLKDKALMSQPSFQDTVSKVLDSSQHPKETTRRHAPSALSKVENRLNSSKILSTQLASVISRLRLIIDPTSIPINASKTPDDASRPQVKPKTLKERAESLGVGSDEDTDVSNNEVEDVDENVLGNDSSSVDPEDGAADSAGWESGSISGSPGPPPSKRAKLAPLSLSNASEDSVPDHNADSDSGPDSDSDVSVYPNRPIYDSGKEDDDEDQNGGASSRFLPALNVGFLKGDGDSDVGGDIDPPKRRNRPGQRARQAVWEKKYGNDAKHLQNQSENGNASASRHGQVRGRGRGRGGRAGPSSFFSRSDGSRGGREGQNTRTRTTNLHPSWEAKRKAKQRELEQMSAAAAGAQHAGKKVKFD